MTFIFFLLSHEREMATEVFPFSKTSMLELIFTCSHHCTELCCWEALEKLLLVAFDFVWNASSFRNSLLDSVRDGWEWVRFPFIVTSGEVLIQVCLWCYLVLPSPFSAYNSSRGPTQAHHSGLCPTSGVKHLHVFTTKQFCQGEILGFVLWELHLGMCWEVLFRIEAALFWMWLEFTELNVEKGVKHG